MKRSLVILLLLAGTFLFPGNAFAMPPSCNAGVPPGQQCTCSPLSGDATLNSISAVLACCQKLPGVFYYTSDCIQSLATISTSTFISSTFALLNGAVITVMTIALAGFGISIITGGVGPRKIKSEAAALIFKMVLIIGVLLSNYNVTALVQSVVSSANNLGQAIITKSIGAAAGNGSGSIWMLCDNIFSQLLGAAASNVGFVIGAIAVFLIAIVLTGPIGIAIIFFILGIIGTVFITFLSILYVQLTSVFALTFLAAFAPIFLPMMLFKEKKLHGMFERWFKMLILYSLQPIIMTAYLGFTIILLSSSIGLNLTNLGTPAQNSILDIIQNTSLITTCQPLQPYFSLTIPCLSMAWVQANLVNFFILVIGAFVIARATKDLSVQIPNIMRRIISDFNTPEHSLAKGDMEGGHGVEGIEQIGSSIGAGAESLTGKVGSGIRSGIGSVLRAPFKIFG